MLFRKHMIDYTRMWTRSVDVYPDEGEPDVWAEMQGLFEGTAHDCGANANALFPSRQYKFIGPTNFGREDGALALEYRGSFSTWVIRYTPMAHDTRLASGQILNPRDVPPRFKPGPGDITI